MNLNLLAQWTDFRITWVTGDQYRSPKLTSSDDLWKVDSIGL